MAATENSAAGNTKNIGSASQDSNMGTQSANNEFKNDYIYSEEQDYEEKTEDGEDSPGYSSHRGAEEETAQTHRTKVTSKHLMGPHGAQKQKGPHSTFSCLKRRAKMPSKGGRDKKRSRSTSTSSSSSESSSSSRSDSSDTDSSSTEEENRPKLMETAEKTCQNIC